MGLKIGQKLYRDKFLNGTLGGMEEVEITKIGRKYFYTGFHKFRQDKYLILTEEEIEKGFFKDFYLTENFYKIAKRKSELVSKINDKLYRTSELSKLKLEELEIIEKILFKEEI